MEQRGHPILYAVIGALTAWPGGAVAGYLYTKAAREANYLRGVPDNSLVHNPLFGIIVGSIFAPVSGAIYGYMFAQKEVEVTDLKVAVARQQIINRDPYISEVMAQQHEASYWRDRAAQLDQVRYQER